MSTNYQQEQINRADSGATPSPKRGEGSHAASPKRGVGLHAAADTGSRAKKRGVLGAVAAVAMAAVLAAGTVLSPLAAFAAAEHVTGSGGVVGAGATTNTFAQDMNLQTIYLDRSILTSGQYYPTITGSNVYSPGSAEVRIRADKVKATGVTTFTDESWSYTYPNAAIDSDNNKHDVTITYTLDKIYTGTDGYADTSTATYGSSSRSIKFMAKGTQFDAQQDNRGTNQPQAFKAFVTGTITISGASGTYILPFSGINAVKGTGGAWGPLINYNPESLADRMDWGREEMITSGDRYAPPQSQTDFRSGGQSLSGSGGSDGNYNAGFAVQGTSGTSFTAGIIGGYNNGYQNNSVFVQTGDLQHRIESWSGDHGKIETGVSGTGTDLPGGTTAQHKWYVVPDAKRNVTYTMTADPGYTADEVTVDGNTVSVPEDVKPGWSTTINSTDGAGTLTYTGGGVFTYVFSNSNTQDHTINVTWKKETANIIVTKFWNDNNDAAGKRPATMPEIQLTSSTGATYTMRPVPNSNTPAQVDGDAGSAYTWEGLDVYEYDSSGNATNPITYTLKEVSDPASSDYAKAIWLGPDYEGGTADGGFTLTNPNVANKMRDNNDPYTAVVTNTVKRDAEITKNWVDNNNALNLRPAANVSSGYFTLYKDNTKAETVSYDQITVTDNQDNTYRVVWEGVPAYDVQYDANNNPSAKNVTYFAEETTVPTSYTITAGVGGVNENGTITNELDVTLFTVYKNWNDGLDHSKRPTSSADIANFGKDHFTLYAQEGASGTPAPYTAIDPTTIIHDTNHDMFVITWVGLPKKINGNAAIYTAAETTVPTSYSREATDADRLNDGDTVTNTLLKDVEFTKTWDDNSDHYSERPAANATAGNYSLYDDSSMATAIANVTISGAATAVNPTITRSGNTDTITYKDLPAYDTNGDPINYYLKETTTPNDYVITDGNAGVEENGNITNTINKQVIEVTKVWNDADILAENKGYARKDITFTYAATYDGSTATDDLTILPGESDSDASTDGTYKVDDNTFAAVFDNLPRYDSAGNEIAYTVSEKIDGNDANTQPVAWETTGGSLTEKADGTGKETTFTNTPIVDDEYNPVTLTLNKADKNTNAGLNGATFKVYTDAGCTTLANQTAGDDQQVQANEATTAAAGASDGVATITFLKSGTYYIKETAAPNGYTAESSVMAIQVDTELKTITLEANDADHPTAWWQKLYDLIFGGTPATSDTVSYDSATKTLTVKDEPITANILVYKTWDDGNDQDGIRPHSDMPKVKLQKYDAANDSWVDVDASTWPTHDIPDTNDRVVASIEDHYTWGSLPAYENGQALKYRVKETGALITGNALTAYSYTAKTLHDPAEEFFIANTTASPATPRDRTVNVTNTHTPQTITVKVNKTWNDTDATGRAAADVSLYKTVGGVKTLVNTKAAGIPVTDVTDGSISWDSLPAYEGGNPITYTVEEAAPTDYRATYKVAYTDTSDAAVDTAGDSVDATAIKRTFDTLGTDPVEITSATVTVTNTDLIEIPVQKTWVNGANSTVTYKLYRTTKAESELTTSAYKPVTSTIDASKQVTTWEPTAEDGWEEVTEAGEVTFGANLFQNKTAAQGGDTYGDDTGEYRAFPNKVPKEDLNGNKYLYRILEEPAGSSLFEADYDTNGRKVTNTNKKAASAFANANVVKELSGRNWIDENETNGDHFYFNIEADHADVITGNGTDHTTGDRIAGTATGFPMPDDGNASTTNDTVGEANTGTLKVGAIGRNVPFNSIEYGASDLGLGETIDYFYKVYESDSTGTKIATQTIKGVTYAGTGSGSSFVPEEHTLRVRVVRDAQGAITTEIYWDKNTTSSAVPVYTNTYNASAQLYGYIIKNVSGREYAAGDEFKFKVVNLSGSILRAEESGTASTTPVEGDAATITNSTGTQVTAGTGGNYDPSSGGTNATRATRTTTNTWIKASDLAYWTGANGAGKATDTFIYEFREDSGSASANSDLEFDESLIYLKAVVTDNQDGTLDIQTSYWKDAACTSRPLNQKVLIDKDTGAVATTSSTNTDYVPAAYFNNSATIDIPVTKEWVGGPAIEDVTLHLERHLFPLTVESQLDDDYVKRAESSGGDDFWETVGNTHIIKRGDFVNNDGTPKYDDGSSTTSSKTYADIEDFNKNLPMYVVKNGVTYRAVYKLLEDDTSDAYTTTYRSIQSGGTEQDGDQIFVDSGTMVVTNTVKATNVAKVAAVKQLLGRKWLTGDDFEFVLTPYGKATYDATGAYTGIDTSAASSMPKPTKYVKGDEEITPTAYNKLSDADKAGYTKTEDTSAHAKSNTQKVDQNGNLERLASFLEIPFTVNDLTYDPTDGHMQGDFFYKMKEVVPGDAVAADGQTKYSDDPTATGPWTYQGVTYDTAEHTVHIKVRENRTGDLQVQIAYDYNGSSPADISGGTQFTPVYTNTYDADTTKGATIRKAIMGRNWQSSDSFTFEIQPLGSAPFLKLKADGTGTESYPSEITIDVTDTSLEYQDKVLDELHFALDDLPWTVGPGGAKDPRGTGSDPIVYLSDRTTPATEGMKYGRFVYRVAETANPDDLSLDAAAEYLRITVIDTGNGELDSYVEIFRDRECTKQRFVVHPDTGEETNEPGTTLTFVNQLVRDLDVTKTWTEAPTSDVAFKLQWSTDKEENKTWKDADGTAWLSGVASTKTITRAEYNAGTKTVTFENLPAYVDDPDNDVDMDDKWVYYRVVETTTGDFDTRYNKTAFGDNDKVGTYPEDEYSADKIFTEDEKASDAYPATRTEALYVGNFPHDLKGTAKLHAVKQFIGKEWTDETFTFKLTPIKSKLGSATDYTNYDAETNRMPMPKVAGEEVDTATIDKNSTLVSVNERAIKDDN